jgi:tetratricopeptide (TPR) repeat protein
VSEESEGIGSGTEGNGAGTGPTAVALALAGASREKADAFLDDQRALIADQRRLAVEQHHHLHEQFKSLRLTIWEKRAGILLRVATAAVGIGVACFLGAVVWNAAHDDGLIVESFSVPPDLAARGLTGQVVATQMLDNLSDLQAQTVTIRAPGSYANDWGNDLKVEIPDTGVSIGELNNYLHKLLGHQTRISGEVVHTATGLAVTARSGVDSGKRFYGPDSDFDALLQQAAEAVYAGTQPQRYGIYLIEQGKTADAIAFIERNKHSGTPTEQAWLNAALSTALGFGGRPLESVESAHAAVAANPGVAFGWNRVAFFEVSLGHAEAGLAASRNALRLLNGSASKDLRREAVMGERNISSGAINDLIGDYAAARQNVAGLRGLNFSADVGKQVQVLTSSSNSNSSLIQSALAAPDYFASDLIADHDMGQIPQALAAAPAFARAFAEADAARGDPRSQAIADGTMQAFRYVGLSLAAAMGDWARVLQTATVMEARQPSIDAADAAISRLYPPTNIWPLVAQAEAMRGDFAAAHAEIDKTPGDCDLCLRMRGKIDAAQKNYDGAAFWFARATQLAPSIPFAFTDWGAMLLAKGDPDGAIAQFTTANVKGPHFADPLEGWGEALMAKNQSHLALAKFAEAEKYAPNWGRLHLKWGEALVYVGKRDDAKAQFARAGQLDLTPSEKIELARSHAVATNP